MKTAKDPRHLRRIRAVKALFSHTFNSAVEIRSARARRVLAHQEKIDGIITECAPEWPISQINRLDLCVLRQAVYELLYKKKTPPKVIIDEAIEVAKRYGSSSSGAFVNGVLASALKATKRDVEIEAKPEAESTPQTSTPPTQDALPGSTEPTESTPTTQ